MKHGFIKFSRVIYSLLFIFLLPLIFLRLYVRGKKANQYRRRWAERLGFFEGQPKAGGIWVHAVSVGETVASIPLIKVLQQRYPEKTITVTTMTPTGSARVKAAFKDSVFHVYLPYDIPLAINRFLKKVQPSMAIIMETELWPNLVFACEARKIPLILANGRLSEKSLKGYQRFLPWVTPMLNHLTCIAAQSAADAKRYLALGFSKDKLEVMGNVKFDIQVPETQIKAGYELKQSWSDRPVWVAASTHQGEESMVLKVHQQLLEKFPSALLILVPRHPERFPEVAQLIQEHNLNFARRSLGQTPEADTSVYLGDTMGEMNLYYSASDIAFVGGSLVPIGGHNLLEPAALKVPVLSGPHLRNFVAISELLLETKGLQLVHHEKELLEVLCHHFQNPTLRKQMGLNAFSVIENNTGALDKLMSIIQDKWAIA